MSNEEHNDKASGFMGGLAVGTVVATLAGFLMTAINDTNSDPLHRALKEGGMR